MSTMPLRLLLVEDNPGDARLLQEMLIETGVRHELTHVGSLGAAVDALAGASFDAVLLDLSLPDGKGLTTLGRVREWAQDMPVVVMTGLGDDETSIMAVQAGAQDYLVKGEFTGRTMFRAVQYAIERSRAERIDRERRSLESALNAMDRLLGIIGHELRTPLTSLRLLSEYLLSGQRDTIELWEHFLRSINSEVLRMTDMVNNLLEAARFDSGLSKWNWGEVGLAGVCRDAISVVEPQVDKGRVSLEAAVEPPDLTMQGDPDAIRRLLVNLISNAIKHTESGRIDVIAREGTLDGERSIELCVRDTGKGISDDTAQRLGSAFATNTGVAGSSDSGGTGLGLAICKGIAAAHGGAISVSSALGRGTVFKVRLKADLPEPTAMVRELKIIREAAA